MTDPIRTPAEALEAAARVAYFQMMKEPLCSAVSVAASIRALAPRIAAPDDEALSRYRVRCETLSAIAAIIQDHAMEADGVMDDIEADEAARAILSALREAGALRHE